MKHLRTNLVALGAAVAIAAFCGRMFAQDDLDDLLKDLEAESSSPSVGESEAAEEPAAEEPAAVEEPAAEESAEEDPAAEEPVADEPAAEAEEDAPAAEEEPSAEEPAAEEPTEEAPVAEEPAEEEETAPEEPVAEEPTAEEPTVEEPAAEEPAEEPVAEEPAATEETVEEVLDTLNDLASEGEEEPAAEEPAAEEPAAEEPAAEEPVAEEPAAEEPVAEEPAAEEPAPAPEVAETPAPTPAPAAQGKYDGPDAELIANIEATERLRREAYDLQARREIEAARRCMQSGEYQEAIRHYAGAKRLLSDTAASAGLRRECDQGIAEGLYRAALQEEATGRRERAKKLMERALDMRHPKARRQLESWKSDVDPDKNKTDISEITARRNEDAYKELRVKNLQHLKRSRQLLGARELDRALDECELVLLTDPYNQAAIRIRETIQKKRHTIITQERRAAREGMLADVDKAWRQVYAVDAREVSQSKSQTMKTPLGGGDPTLAQEQTIIKRMKEMRLPSISFKPPATIIEAIDFFRGASRDYDRPDIPIEQRGFNFVLKTPETLRSSGNVVEEDSEGFGGGDDEEPGAAQAGVPVIPMITASDITFYEALKLVCESVQYKFKVQGPIVMVMPKDMSIEEMVTRSYPVVSAFMERMGSASSDMKEMKSAGFGGGSSSRRNDEDEENQERDWKEFFSLLGVQWPEGSSIMYIKTIGKLRVKNTYENLAELEKALTEMNADPKLIEIEARFVEVCQEDLNSLGFEWILNSDYSIGLGKHVARALNLKPGKWGSEKASYSDTWTGTYEDNRDSLTKNSGTPSIVNSVSDVTGYKNTYQRTSTTTIGGSGGSWSRNYNSSGRSKNLGINAFGGDSDQGQGLRYLSTDSNHISGESNSTNDQFMRLNAFLGNADLSMILHMLSQRSDTDLLSAPKVLTKPGEEAVIKVVTEFIYPTDYDVQLQSSSSSSGSNSSSQSAVLAVVEPQSFTMREVGVILDVTPTLTDDGNLIDLKLNTQVVDEPTWKNYGMRIPFTGNASSLENFTGLGEIFTGLSEILTATGTALSDASKAVFAQTALDTANTALASLTSSNDNITYYEAPMEQPFFHVRSIDSSVSVYPGATIVMGGLITEQRKAMDDKIPFLGDLPFIGRLFRSHSEQTSKRNLLIFVTTRLVDVRGREVTMGESDEKDEAVKPAPTEED